RRSLERALAVSDVLRVHVSGYANGYAGYLTTPEEYDVQGYEGAYTLFGRNSLKAFGDELVALARALPSRARDLGPALELCDAARRAARTRGCALGPPPAVSYPAARDARPPPPASCPPRALSRPSADVPCPRAPAVGPSLDLFGPSLDVACPRAPGFGPSL